MNKISLYFLILIVFAASCENNKEEEAKPAERQLKDGSGNVYTSVKIGEQEWLTSNLKTKKFRNGDPIPTIRFDSILISIQSPKYQWSLNNADSNETKYGLLYTWYVATDPRGVCPTGYHLPNNEEWQTLINYLGGSGQAATKLMVNSGNLSGFTGKSASARVEGYNMLYSGSHTWEEKYMVETSDGEISSHWWSSTDKGSVYPLVANDFLARAFSPSAAEVGSGYGNIGSGDGDYKGFYKNSGLYIRCLKDQ